MQLVTIKYRQKFKARCVSAWYLFLLFTLPLSAIATETALQHLSTALDFKTLQATFSQTVRDHGQLLQESSGDLSILRPGYFLWQVKQPRVSAILLQHHHLTLYEPELNQVTYLQMQPHAMQAYPALLLTENNQDVLADFTVTEPKTGQFILVPKKENGLFQRVVLTFSETGTLKSITIRNHLDQNLAVTLTQVIRDQPIAKEVFKLALPQGTVVINMEHDS